MNSLFFPEMHRLRAAVGSNRAIVTDNEALLVKAGRTLLAIDDLTDQDPVSPEAIAHTVWTSLTDAEGCRKEIARAIFQERQTIAVLRLQLKEAQERIAWGDYAGDMSLVFYNQLFQERDEWRMKALDAASDATGFEQMAKDAEKELGETQATLFAAQSALIKEGVERDVALKRLKQIDELAAIPFPPAEDVARASWSSWTFGPYQDVLEMERQVSARREQGYRNAIDFARAEIVHIYDHYSPEHIARSPSMSQIGCWRDGLKFLDDVMLAMKAPGDVVKDIDWKARAEKVIAELRKAKIVPFSSGHKDEAVEEALRLLGEVS